MDLQKDVPGVHSQMCPPYSHEGNGGIRIKTEVVSDVELEEDPVPVSFQEIKLEEDPVPVSFQEIKLEEDPVPVSFQKIKLEEDPVPVSFQGIESERESEHQQICS